MLGSVFTISSFSLPRSTMITDASMSVVKKYPGMLAKAKSIILCASISDVIITDLNDTFMDVASLFFNT